MIEEFKVGDIVKLKRSDYISEVKCVDRGINKQFTVYRVACDCDNYLQQELVLVCKLENRESEK
jgi:hypothetical protein